MQDDQTKPAGPVPEPLMDQLHKAHDRFHRARQSLEAELVDIGERRRARVDAAADSLRAAEREVERVTEKIQEELHAQVHASPTALPPMDQIGPVADLEPLR